MKTPRLSRLVGYALLLLATLSAFLAGSAFSEDAREADALQAKEESVRDQEAVEVPSLEDMALRLREIEELLVLSGLAERVARLEQRAAESGDLSRSPTGGDALADLARRVQRLEMTADPTTDFRQMDTRIRTLENRLSRVESDLRTMRRPG